MKKPVIYVDLDDTIADYNKAYLTAIQRDPTIVNPQRLPRFFQDLEPIDGAIDGFNKLYHNPRAEVYLLSAPGAKSPLSLTEKRLWVEQHLGEFVAGNRLILTPNKGLQIGDYLVDNILQGCGQENFKGKIIHFGSAKYPTWKDVNKYFDVVLNKSMKQSQGLSF